jgi:hypothetical protein
MIYTPDALKSFSQRAEAAARKPVTRYGVIVHVDTDCDWAGPDFIIQPLDLEGLKIFKEFAMKMAAHYNSLKIKP